MDQQASLFEVERQDDTVILTPLRNLGEFAMDELHQEVDQILESCERSQVRNLLLDFEKTDYLQSTALGFLQRLHKRVIDRQGKMVLCHLSEHEREVLEITNLDTLWPIFDSREDALESLQHQT